MFNSSATPSYMNPAERVRQQWHAFEQWVQTVPRAAMEQEITQNFQEMDAQWKATPVRGRPSKQEHDKSKAAYRRELEEGLVLLAREEWQRRLEAAGLRDEDWGEMTFKETLAAERLLGGDLDEEGMAIMEKIAREEEALSNATRGGYSFVSPMSLSIADDVDDDPDGFESIYPFEIPRSSGPASVASLTDEIFDTPTMPWGWAGDNASSYGIWSAATSQSSRQSSQTSSPERPPKPTLPTSRAKDAVPPPPFAASASRAPAGPRYIGPHLSDPDDDDAEDEAAFERFKMDARVAKIREFHDEAARADVQLAQDIYDVRRASARETWRAEEARKIKEHEARMVELRRRKEEERKAVVMAERYKRRAEIELRKQREQQLRDSAVGAESLKQRLAQEVESSLYKMGSGSGFVGAPDAASVLSAAEAEMRHARRRSMTATSASQTPTVRKSDRDRLAASVSDLLETGSTISFASSASTTTAATSTSTSTSTSSASARPQIWFPSPAEIDSPEVTPMKPTKKKNQAQQTRANVGRVAMPDLAQAATPVATPPPAKPAKKTVPLPSVADPAAAPAVSPAQQQQQQPSWANISSVSPENPNPAPVPSVGSKRPSPPSKGPSPPAKTAFSVASSSAASSAGKSSSKSQSPQAPLSAASSKAPTPPVVTKGPSPPASKGPSPPVSKGPSPPVSKGPSPPASKGPSPPASSNGPSTSASASASTTNKAPSPPVVAPKSSDSSSSVSSKKAATHLQGPAETETPGASSSRTTLEHMQRPFIHKSLGSSAELWMAPPPLPPAGVWVSSSASASASANAKKLDASTVKITPGSQSTKIERVPSMPAPVPLQPQPRLPLFAGTTASVRGRRMSDPVSPSPRSFLFGENRTAVQVDTLRVPGAISSSSSAAKKGKAAKQNGKARRVTMEEVSDEEDAGPAERLPVDSKIIFEPKPSVPPTMYSSIIDFTAETPRPPAPTGASRSQGEAQGQSGFLTTDGKNAKEKHVRWTPSAVGNDGGGGGAGDGNALRAALEGFEASAAATASAPAPSTGKGRRRTSSLLQQATGMGMNAIDRKGKGKGKERMVAVDPERQTEADFERFVMGATQDLVRG